MNAFVTGCDKNTEWQLPWFLERYRKYNPNLEIIVCDFGMTHDMIRKLDVPIIEVDSAVGWYKKPATLIEATKYADKVFWIDTDCEVRGDLSHIFNYIVPDKLTVAVDRPITNRQNIVHYNTGVMGCEGIPNVLQQWEKICRRGGNHRFGDQTILNDMISGNDIMRSVLIEELPQMYNTLRLDFIDGTSPAKPLVCHWTGPKGNLEIQEQMAGIVR